MKLSTYLLAGERRVGAVVGDTLIDLTHARAHMLRAAGEPEAAAIAAAELPGDLMRILARPAGLDTARAAADHGAGLDAELARRELVALSFADVVLLPPLPSPPKIVCVA